MYRNLLYLFASIALVSAQSNNNTSANVTVTTTTTSSPIISSTLSPTPSTSNTSEASSTTESTTNTSTTATPKTTTLTPTTPPTPEPIPKPEKWSGNVTDDKNRTCINVEFSVQITITYNSSIDKKALTAGFTIPVNATVDPKGSHCSPANKSEPETIGIIFKDIENTSANLVLTFNKTDDEQQIIVQQIKLSFNATSQLLPQLDPNLYGKYLTAEATNLELFKVKSEHSYLCSAEKSANLAGDHLNDVQIQFTDSQVEAYIKDSNKGKFDIVMDCKTADISDVVPIAVGAALAGLVIIVLIAYFVGRRRSRRLAYQSV